MGLTDKNLKDFSKVLAGNDPVPGGGGAAALSGALGIALGSMVGNFTLGKKKYRDVEEDIKALLKEAEDIRHNLIELIDEDAKAFWPLSKAYGISKDDPCRESALENATITAAEPPLKMVRQCAKALRVIREMQLKGSKMLISDAGCGAALSRAAMEAAAMNVFINTKSLKDRTLAEEMEREVDSILAECIPLAETIVSEVTGSIRG